MLKPSSYNSNRGGGYLDQPAPIRVSDQVLSLQAKKDDEYGRKQNEDGREYFRKDQEGNKDILVEPEKNPLQPEKVTFHPDCNKRKTSKQ